MRSRRGTKGALLAITFLCATMAPPAARTDCLTAVWADPWAAGIDGVEAVFPNWSRALVASYGIYTQDDLWSAWCLNSSITGITLFNYGSASGGPGGDLPAVYWALRCGTSTNTAPVVMTYAGVWTVGGTPYPAWTWAGAQAFGGDPCTDCACFPTLSVYADVAACPTEGASVDLGPGFGAGFSAAGITDNCVCGAPWAEVRSEAPKVIRYIFTKGSLAMATPGDTISFTVYAGRAGSAAYSNLVILDSLPPFTHYLPGTAVPPADVGWDPDLGPPTRLRWTLPGGSPTGGATVEVRFSVTVDWGNAESFEPGSGDQGAPEGARLANGAAASWIGGGCAGVPAVSPPTQTVVRRFLFWKIGSNDLLMAGRMGQPDDEMTYDIFVKNLSATKTWWDVTIWDTVPTELDPWGPNRGFEDPCQGWTMSPSGCAAASPGRVTAGGSTILTWRLNLPPAATISVRWKAALRTTASAGGTIVNRASVLAMGNAGVVNGTGHSGAPALFTHLAPVILRTTYYSYTSWAAAGDQRGCSGFFIAFFPLNAATAFELRKLEYANAGVAVTGGKSASIGAYTGTCLTGFLDGGLSSAGCKVERIPAMYWPGIWDGICPAYPFDFLYKVTSNSPFLWTVMSEGSAIQMDAHTWLPSTSMTYRGFMHYGTFRPAQDALATAGRGDRAAIFNTGMDETGAFDATQATTVHGFRWNSVNLSWDYQLTGEIDGESLWMPLEGTPGTTVNDVFHWRFISSVTQTLVYEGFHTWGAPSIGGSFDNYGGIAPNRENGNLIAAGAPANYYLIAHPGGRTPNVVIGNVGAATATYRIWLYVPALPPLGPNWPATLAGSSGSWRLKGVHTVNAGLPTGANPANPHMYGNGYDLTMTTAATTAQAWKVELLSGGPLEILHGGAIYDSWGGASTIHAADGGASGSEFWWHAGPGGGGFGVSCSSPETYCINVFCPKEGMAVGINSTGGWSATYTSDGPDQAIVFLPLTRASPKHNYRITLRAGSATGQMIAQYFQCTFDEKFLSAPFIETGVHYDVIAPPTVFVGQTFWITVIVVDNGGGTKTDYCGTTSFTSTDPGARIEGTAMELYNFTWSSAAKCSAVPDENGVRVFVAVTMTRLGPQTIVAADTLDGSILGLATVMVVGADVKLFKNPRLSVQASGDTVQFQICWSNYSSASAFTFTITDAVPVGTTFFPEATTAPFDCGNTDGAPVTVAFSLSTSVTPPSPFTTGNPAAGTRWLRWTIPMAGVQTTGCGCFRVTVN